MALNVSHKLYEESLQYYDKIIAMSNGQCKELLPEEALNLESLYS